MQLSSLFLTAPSHSIHTLIYTLIHSQCAAFSPGGGLLFAAGGSNQVWGVLRLPLCPFTPSFTLSFAPSFTVSARLSLRTEGYFAGGGSNQVYKSPPPSLCPFIPRLTPSFTPSFTPSYTITPSFPPFHLLRCPGSSVGRGSPVLRTLVARRGRHPLHSLSGRSLRQNDRGRIRLRRGQSV
jgi:hypothetical protein